MEIRLKGTSHRSLNPYTNPVDSNLRYLVEVVLVLAPACLYHGFENQIGSSMGHLGLKLSMNDMNDTFCGWPIFAEQFRQKVQGDRGR